MVFYFFDYTIYELFHNSIIVTQNYDKKNNLNNIF